MVGKSIEFIIYAVFQLLNFIESVIKKYDIKGEVFADIFSGTCSVGDYFKDSYEVIANDT